GIGAHRHGRAVGRQRDAETELVGYAGIGCLDVCRLADADGAVVIAAVAVDEVAVVALLATRDDAVAAAGQRAVTVATVAAGEVAVVALLARQRRDDAVAAAGRRAVAVAAISVGEVAVVADLARQ